MDHPELVASGCLPEPDKVGSAKPLEIWLRKSLGSRCAPIRLANTEIRSSIFPVLA